MTLKINEAERCGNHERANKLRTLLEEHRTLQTNFDDMISEKEEALAQARQAQRDADSRRVDSRGDAILRAEIDRLRADL